MKKVLVVSAVNEKSPALRYRLIYTLDIMKSEKEIEYEVLSFYAKDTDAIMDGDKLLLKVAYMFRDLIKFLYKLISLKDKYDIIIVKNYVFPVGGVGIEKLIRKKFRGCRVFYDIDDGIYLNRTRKQNSIFNKFRNACEKVKYWSYESEKVMLSNEIIFKDLNEMFELGSSKVVEFLSCPYENQYFNDYDELIRSKDLSNTNFIWLGSPHTQENLIQCEEFISLLPKIVNNPKVYIIGAHKNFRAFRELEHVEFVDWSMENERKYMRMAHIGLNPLVDDEFERRKSAFKAIQYYRAGVIPIVSNVGINKRLVETYGGYCTEKFEISEMKEYLENILSNYEEVSRKIYENTKELTVEANKEKIKNAIDM